MHRAYGLTFLGQRMSFCPQKYSGNVTCFEISWHIKANHWQNMSQKIFENTLSFNTGIRIGWGHQTNVINVTQYVCVLRSHLKMHSAEKPNKCNGISIGWCGGGEG